MKKLLLSALIMFAAITIQAQGNLPVGKMQLNAGLGFSSWGVPIYGGIDYGVHPDITVGGEASFRSYSNHYGAYSYSHTIIGIVGNGNYHFNRILDIPKEFDFYGGLNLGFYIWSSPSNYAGSGASGLGLGLQVGGRYYFDSKFGINLELGGGNSTSGGRIGITYKL